MKLFLQSHSFEMCWFPVNHLLPLHIKYLSANFLILFWYTEHYPIKLHISSENYNFKKFCTNYLNKELLNSLHISNWVWKSICIISDWPFFFPSKIWNDYFFFSINCDFHSSPKPRFPMIVFEKQVVEMLFLFLLFFHSRMRLIKLAD